MLLGKSFFCIYFRDQYNTKVKKSEKCQNVKVMLYLLEIRKEHNNCDILHLTWDTCGIFTSKKTSKFNERHVNLLIVCWQHKLFFKEYSTVLIQIDFLNQKLHSAVLSFYLGNIWRPASLMWAPTTHSMVNGNIAFAGHQKCICSELKTLQSTDFTVPKPHPFHAWACT